MACFVEGGMARARRQTNRVSRQATELAVAVPLVVAQRMARMAMAGSTLTARDRREFQLMGAEKLAAFGESWMAMYLQMFHANQELAFSLMKAWNPMLAGKDAWFKSAQAVQSAMLDILGKGMAPLHKRAVGNARRLSRSGARR
ncbi:polyhydroxyalkanoate granule-associated phasin [Azotobacter salinestris]|uniref:polyhydroxyalkanoate granule-associated phasin n=1 Tax=Azotobacter salinestris TaxID=69964 RepID=UPI001FCBE60A|nr:polyhydroxyalkanoate granule-associated phasin [Azotobacter salinestris]